MLLFVAFFLLIQLCQPHSYLTSPISRSNQKSTRTGCRGPQCMGPCDAPLIRVGQSTPISKIIRGQNVNLVWPRNNHAGGFIRVAWAQTADSDNQSAFNKNIQLWTCHEMTCKSAQFPNDPLGGDSDGDAEGKCTAEITVPSQLPDGNFTLQWAWIGGAYALGDYFSCVDYEIDGGQAHSPGEITPVFTGGDVHNPNENKCLFFNTNDVGICVIEPCTIGNLPGKQVGSPKGFENQDVTPARNPTKPDDDLIISYQQRDIDKQNFEGTASITNNSNNTRSWSFELDFGVGVTLTSVTGAKHAKVSAKTHRLSSRQPLEAGSSTQVVIQGNL